MNGYAGSILVCDLSCRCTTHLHTLDYARHLLGGRGLAAGLYWQLALPESSALSPANPLIMATGPLAGFSGLAGSRWQICAKSPSITPESFSYSNLGGSWGTYLKFAGFDALVVTGMAQNPTYLFIHDGVCEFRDASYLWGMGAAQVRESLKAELGRDVRVLATGPAGENLVSFASILADDDASGSSGFGAVMGAKKLKAVAVSGTNRPEPDDPVKLHELTRFLRDLKKREPQENVLAPQGMKVRRQACLGCTAGCLRSMLERANGQRGKYLCTSGFFYEYPAYDYYHKLNEVPFLATRLCDDYGLDANAIDAIIKWLSRCYQRGIISERESGIPLSQLGSLDFIKALARKITMREDFGAVLAKGVLKAAESLGPDAEDLVPDLICRDGTGVAYCPRMYLTNALIFALEPRQSFPMSGEVGRTVIRWLDGIHDRKNLKVSVDDRGLSPRMLSGNPVSDDEMAFIARHFWGSEAAADFSDYRGKAMAVKMIQDRHSVKESAIMCHCSWRTTQIELFRPEIIAEVLSAVTGDKYEEDSIYRLGERIFNLQRATHVRERKCGRESDTLPEAWYRVPLQESYLNPDLLAPGPEGRPITRKGSVLDRGQIEFMKDEYYRLRGWDIATGLQTASKLKELGLDDVANWLTELNLTR